MKEGDIVYHKVTGEGLIVLRDKTGPDGAQILVRRGKPGENGGIESYVTENFFPMELETVEERAAREADLYKRIKSAVNEAVPVGDLTAN